MKGWSLAETTGPGPLGGGKNSMPTPSQLTSLAEKSGTPLAVAAAKVRAAPHSRPPKIPLARIDLRKALAEDIDGIKRFSVVSLFIADAVSRPKRCQMNLS